MPHHKFGVRKLTRKEREDITAESIEQFKRMYPEWYPCQANAEMITDFIVSQLGNFEGDDPEYPYPLLLENLRHAHDAILASGRWFVSRPVSPEELQEQAEQERNEAIRANQEAVREQIEKGEYVRAVKKLKPESLRLIVANERPSSPNGSKYQLTAQPGAESRPIGMSPKADSKPVPAKVLQEARRKCAIANPTIPRDSVRMNELIHEELQKQN
jgi:hypothetical protein